MYSTSNYAQILAISVKLSSLSPFKANSAFRNVGATYYPKYLSPSEEDVPSFSAGHTTTVPLIT